LVGLPSGVAAFPVLVGLPIGLASEWIIVKSEKNMKIDIIIVVALH
jgi:hypothetical protein